MHHHPRFILATFINVAVFPPWTSDNKPCILIFWYYQGSSVSRCNSGAHATFVVAKARLEHRSPENWPTVSGPGSAQKNNWAPPTFPRVAGRSVASRSGRRSSHFPTIETAKILQFEGIFPVFMFARCTTWDRLWHNFSRLEWQPRWWMVN